MRVDPQTALFVIGRLEDMRVEAPVTQEVLTRIRQGQRVEIQVGSRPEPLRAQISRISPFLRPGSFSAEVEIDVPNDSGSLVPGMFVTVDIFYGESEQTTLVPTSAIYENATTGESGLFVTSGPPPPAPATDGGTSDGRPPPVAAPFRTVEIVAEADQTVGVTGVKPGEWVVVVGQHLLAAQSGGEPQARARAITWERIIELQRLQRQDLLEDFLERQRRGRGEG
jgi:multidrug efflux pump subunit AcrA (membrane-fusion protein)